MDEMKAVILAGGIGSRLQEETVSRPKPMVEIGGRPILWHIMKLYASFGVQDFIVCLGYRGYQVKEYFANYVLHNSDVTVDMAGNSLEFHRSSDESWRVTLIDTGENTMTGGRLKRVEQHLIDSDVFFMTYGDGLADIDLRGLLEYHQSEGTKATVTVVKPPGRFGAVHLAGGKVDHFVEKPPGEGGYINGGFFALTPAVFDYIDGDETKWEEEPMSELAAQGELAAFQHDGFWLPMDTARDRSVLEDLWSGGTPPWKLWD